MQTIYSVQNKFFYFLIVECSICQFQAFVDDTEIGNHMDEFVKFLVGASGKIEFYFRIGVYVIYQFIKKYRVYALFGSYFIIYIEFFAVISAHSSYQHINIQFINRLIASGVIDGNP